MLGIQHYFTVNKLYRKKFLLKNNIFYGEHYIYEDFVFWVKCVLKSKVISLIQSPLYNVRINSQSTTKTNYNSSKHIDGFLKAYDSCINLFDEKSSKGKNLFQGYMMKKFLTYYTIRTPKSLKKYFSDQYYERIKNDDMNSFISKSRYINYGKKLNILKNKTAFKLFFDLYKNKNIYIKVRRLKNKVKNKVKTFIKNDKSKKINSFDMKEQILFMGFDYRYTGNSRYLFENMINNNIDIPIYFCTKDELVEDNYKVLPNTEELYNKLYSSKIVIFESWIPKKFRKPKDAIWINLWHGTPLKKMLYDSNEEEIVSVKPSHKKEKFLSIAKTDYLLTDNENVNHFFETSFLFDSKKILSFGYPRVKYLIENKNNKKLKDSIRKKLDIKENEKVITYLPTWRDYNYGDTEELDFEYFLDREKVEEFCEKNNYRLISKDHNYMRKAENISVTELETQELLLISDFLITDYSSVMFDAFAIDIPVIILAKDFEKYSLSRGVYTEIWNDLKPFVVDNEEELCKLIKNYKINDQYNYIKNKYSYRSDGDLIRFIKDILKGKVENDK